jgi:hypothetical protein
METQHPEVRNVAAGRNVHRTMGFSRDEETPMTAPKSRAPKKRAPKKKDRPKTERPPVTARTPKSGVGQEPSDTERATQHGDRDFDPNVNQRPR